MDEDTKVKDRPPRLVSDFCRISGDSIVRESASPLLESEIWEQEGCELSRGCVVLEVPLR